MDKIYRVVVWGPGGLGAVCIWEISRNPRYKLVGVRAYSDSKVGIDAGTLIGIEPLGVLVTTDAKAALEIECDCIVYTARDFGDYRNDDEILSILTAGRNVVTALPYQHLRLTRDAEFQGKLDAACAIGRSTFHATGVDPDVIGDRVLPALTGLCSDIKYIKLQENWDSSYTPAATLAMCGFGKLPSEARKMPIAEGLADNFLRQVCFGLGDALGVAYSHVESSHEYIPTAEDLPGPLLSVRAGTVGRVTHRWSAFVDADEPFFTVEVNWVLGPSMLPVGAEPNQYWVVTIEGRPSVKMIVDLKASMETMNRFIDVGGQNTEPGYHGVIAACLQAIPSICDSQPGVLPCPRPSVHWNAWQKDYRG